MNPTLIEWCVSHGTMPSWGRPWYAPRDIHDVNARMGYPMGFLGSIARPMEYLTTYPMG